MFFSGQKFSRTLGTVIVLISLAVFHLMKVFAWSDDLASSTPTTPVLTTDWRLHNLKDLSSLAKRASALSVTNEAVSPQTNSDLYWSSSLFYSEGSASRGIDFESDTSGQGLRTNMQKSRLVHGEGTVVKVSSFQTNRTESIEASGISNASRMLIVLQNNLLNGELL